MPFRISQKEQHKSGYPSVKENNKLKTMILEELLRQNHHNYNLAFITAIASSVIGLTNIGLVFFRKAPASSLTTTSGIITGIVSSVQLTKQSREELDRLLNHLEK